MDQEYDAIVLGTGLKVITVIMAFVYEVILGMHHFWYALSIRKEGPPH